MLDESNCRCLIHQAKLDKSSNYRESSDDNATWLLIFTEHMPW